MRKRILWHRLFGIALMDYFAGSCYEVQVEIDLSLKKQIVDILLIRKRDGEALRDVLDGFEDLRAHNLVTYKSLREPMTLFALRELLAHDVNYEKKTGTKARDVGLYAIATREPKAVLEELSWRSSRPGIYDGEVLGRSLRLIVLSRVAEESRNAFWALFSGLREKVAFGKKTYPWHMEDWSGVIHDLFLYYKMEGVDMPYTIEKFRRDFVRRNLDALPPEERLAGLRPEERLAGLRPEERLAGLRPEDVFRRYAPEERLAGLDDAEIEAVLARRRAEAASRRGRNPRRTRSGRR